MGRLGHKHGLPEMIRDARRLSDAAISEGVDLTRDLGGTASTTEAADAVARALEVSA